MSADPQEVLLDERAIKRQRVTKACNTCRSKKSKCDGNLPKCAACVTCGSKCEYSPQSKRRGHPPGLVQQLTGQKILVEIALGLLLSTVPGIDNVVSGMLEKSSESMRDDSEQLLMTWRTSKSHNQLHGIDEGMGQGISGLPTHPHPPTQESSANFNSLPFKPYTAEMQSPNQLNIAADSQHPVTSGSGSNVSDSSASKASSFRPSHPLSQNICWPLDTSYRNIQQTAAKDGESNHETTISYTSTLAAYRRVQAMSVRQRADMNLLALNHSFSSSTQTYPDVPPQVSENLDLYFTNVHSTLPMIDKMGALQFLHKPPSTVKPGAVTTSPREMNAVLWLACSLGASSANHGNETGKIFSERLTADSYACALASLGRNDPSTVHKLDRMQMLLLFSLSLISGSLWTCARETMALARCLACSEKQFNDPPHQTDSSVFRDSARRTWAVYTMLETLLAGRFETQPPLCPRKGHMLLDIEEGWEEWDSWVSHSPQVSRKSPARITSVFNQLLRLTSTFNRYLTTIYSCSSSKMTNSSVSHVSGLAEDLNARLSTWVQELPQHIRIEMILTSAELRLKSQNIPALYLLNLNIAYHVFACFSFHESLQGAAPDSVDKTRPQRYKESLTLVVELMEMMTQAYNEDFWRSFYGLFIYIAQLPSVTTSGTSAISTMSKGYRESIQQLSARFDMILMGLISKMPHVRQGYIEDINRSETQSEEAELPSVQDSRRPFGPNSFIDNDLTNPLSSSGAGFDFPFNALTNYPRSPPPSQRLDQLSNFYL
ncbi:hypothetical protein BKA64DRAFT_252192 [Cadophora sp. MPI-SDFR-AT-0126]|nr:hypothetical protein BKA64DRAFT_252192 [Leotiomycetes sp. MPI-SDFR-AT-0126]